MARRTKEYRGVYLSRTGLYRALGTTRPGETTYLGNWPTAREAAIAVDRATLYFERDDLELNLSDESRSLGPLSPEALIHEARRARKKETASSQYVGVCKLKNFELWTAFAHVPGKGESVHLGTFQREVDAAIAHDRYVVGVQGRDVPLNFPGVNRNPATPEQLCDWARRLKQEPRAGRYAGVTLRDWNTKVPWASSLRVEGRAVYLGSWRTPKAAATAHDRAALHYNGDDAFLNFPKARADLVPASAAELRIEANQKRKRKTSSRYIGVSWLKRDRRWLAVIMCAGKYQSIGRFDDEKEAALRRDQEALRLLGNEARLNFHPRTGEEVFGLRFRDIVEKEASRRRRRRSG